MKIPEDIYISEDQKKNREERETINAILAILREKFPPENPYKSPGLSVEKETPGLPIELEEDEMRGYKFHPVSKILFLDYRNTTRRYYELPEGVKNYLMTPNVFETLPKELQDEMTRPDTRIPIQSRQEE